MSPFSRRVTPMLIVGALTFGSLAPVALAQDADTEAEPMDLTSTVEAMRDAGVGFGAIVHLTSLASQLDMDALELLETMPVVDGEFDFNFGAIKQQLDPEQRAALKEQARVYRALVKAAKAELKAMKKSMDVESDESEESEDLEEVEGLEENEESEDLEDEAADSENLEAKAMLIADAFDMPVEDVIALRLEGYGWGAMFRLASLAHAVGVSVDDLLASDEGSGEGLALGKLRKMLTADQLAELEKGPRNFGHLVSGKSEAPGKSGEARKDKKPKKPKKNETNEG